MARPIPPSNDNDKAGRYPPVEKDDSIAPPRPGEAGERRNITDEEPDESLLGPRGDPAEGKR